MNFSKLLKSYILNEVSAPTPSGAIQAVREVLSSLKPSTNRDRNRIHLAMEQLGHVGRHVRSLTEEVTTLKEQLSILEEGNKEK
jgi:polyhydroxyalkanoate synthesis regulator phasin